MKKQLEMDKVIEKIETFLSNGGHSDAECYLICSIMATRYKDNVIEFLYPEEIEEELDEEEQEPELEEEDDESAEEEQEPEPIKPKRIEAVKSLLKKPQVKIKKIQGKEIDNGDF